MKKKILNYLFAGVAAVGLSSAATSVQAVDLPCKTAKLIVPWGAGGGTHILFTLIEKTISTLDVKTKLKVVTIGGQGGNKGAKEAHNSKPDGCTLFAIHQSAFTSYLNGRIDYHYDGFDMVAKLTSTADIVGANKDAPYKDFNELKKAAIDAKRAGEVTEALTQMKLYKSLIAEQRTIGLSEQPETGATAGNSQKKKTRNLYSGKKKRINLYRSGNLKSFFFSIFLFSLLTYSLYKKKQLE